MVKFTRESLKSLVFRNALRAARQFFGNSIFLQAGLAKWRRRKRIGTLEAGRRKQTKANAVEQPYMDNIPMGLNEFDDS